MRHTAPGAVMLGTAALAGHRVAIGQAGYGTLLPAAEGTVHGIVWELTEGDEQALDQFEGVDRGFYRKASKVVSTAAGPLEAMVYLAVDGRPGVASPDYIRQVVTAAKAAGFPPRYLAELAGLPSEGSQDEPWIPPVHQSEPPSIP